MSIIRTIAITAATGAMALGTAAAGGVAHAGETYHHGVVVGTGSEGLSLRPDPSTAGAPVDNYRDGVETTLWCAVQGEDVMGETTWYKVPQFESADAYVSRKFIKVIGPEPDPC